MADKYLDLLNGNDANNGSCFVLRKKTLAAFSGVANPGDRIKVMGSGAPYSLSTTALWTNSSDQVVFTTPNTKSITPTGFFSTTHISWSTSSPARQGSFYNRFGVANTAVGEASYSAISGGTVDFSAYNQITFWINCSGTLPANSIQIQLCSDAVGTVVVNTFTIPIAIPSTSTASWVPITLPDDVAAPFGASVQSVTIAVIANPGSVTIGINNIEACTTFSLNSLIGKNTGSSDTWYAMKSIVAGTVTLDTTPYDNGGHTFKYGGVTETVDTYARETVKCTITTSDIQKTAFSGTAVSPITISGGWDTTNMSSQDSETWLDGRVGRGIGWNIEPFGGGGGDYIITERLGATRCDYGFYIQGGYFGNGGSGFISGANNCLSYGIYESGVHPQLNQILGCAGSNIGLFAAPATEFFCKDIYNAHSNIQYGIDFNNPLTYSVSGSITANANAVPLYVQTGGGRFGNITCKNNTTNGIQFVNQYSVIIDSYTAISNNTYALQHDSPNQITISNLTSSGHSTACIRNSSSSGNNEISTYIYNASVTDPLMFSQSLPGHNSRVYSQNEGGNINKNYVYTDGGYIAVDSVLYPNPVAAGGSPHTPGGLDYTIGITGVTRVYSYPIVMKIPGLAFNAGSLVTFTAYIKRSSTTQVFGQLYVLGGSIPGVTSDVVATVDASNTNYNLYTISFTPTGMGACDVYFSVWGDGVSTTQYMRIADVNLTQT